MFKDKLRQLRIENNLTQADLAKAIGVSPATIGNYEQGTREPRNNESWQKLADYFGISVDELIDKKHVMSVATDNIIDKNSLIQENMFLKQENEMLKRKLETIMKIIDRK